MSSKEKGWPEQQPIFAYPNEATPDTPYEAIDLPLEVDEAWCDIASEVYANSQKTAQINARYFMRQIGPAQPDEDKTFIVIPVPLFKDGHLDVTGRLTGFRIWESIGPGENRQPRLHAVMKDAVFSALGIPLSNTPEQEIMVPLKEGLRQVLLYAA